MRGCRGNKYGISVANVFIRSIKNVVQVELLRKWKKITTGAETKENIPVIQTGESKCCESQ
jgi:hypothetical protein